MYDGVFARGRIVTVKPLTRPSSEQIRAVAGQIVRQFYPRKVILFGSFAYGHPTEDSDVDLLVILDRERVTLHDVATISQAIDHPFPLDIIVQSSARWEADLREGASFAREISEKGKVLYEARDH